MAKRGAPRNVCGAGRSDHVHQPTFNQIQMAFLGQPSNIEVLKSFYLYIKSLATGLVACQGLSARYILD